MTNREKLLDRQDRILRAIHHELNDRTPLLMSGDCALLRYSRPDASFAWMLENMDDMYDIIAGKTLPALPKIDYMGGASGLSPRFLGAAFLGKTRLPGKELPAGEMWQPVLGGTITEDDYRTIADRGWTRFREHCLFDRLGISPEEMSRDAEQTGRNVRKLHEAGYPFLLAPPTPAPFDFLCLGRGPREFYIDIVTCPDLVHAAIDAITDEWLEENRDVIPRIVENAWEEGRATMFSVMPCVYANCDLVSRDVFEEFGWPLFRRITDLLLESGAYIFLHLDTNWTAFLDLFSELPKNRCIFDTDGGTDLHRLLDMHGSRFAITGNIAPALLAFGTPDEVYRACRQQIEEMGPSYILSPACTLPANMPRANFDAMYAAIE